MKKFKFNKVSIIVLAVMFTLGLVGPISAFAAGPAVIDLGSLETNNFVIFGQTGVTDANPAETAVTGNVGTSLVASPAVTGLSCTEVLGDGKIYILTTAGYAGGHDSNVSCLLTDDTIVPAAVDDFTTAYNDAAAAKTPTVLPGSGTLGVQTIVPGTYKWAGNVTITGDVTLSGGANDVWIFQIGGTLDIQPGFKILLDGGAQAKNIFWAVAGYTELFAGSTFEGNILGWSYIAMDAGAILDGRALSKTQVTLIGNTVGIVVVDDTEEDVPPVSHSSSGSSITYGCKDETATNYNYFSTSKPSLCEYASVIAVVTPTPVVIVPKLPKTGFPPQTWYESLLNSLLNLFR